MKQILVKLLQGLRAQQNYALFALVSSLDDVQFTADQIIVQTNNQAEYQMLTKHLATLHELCGQECLVIKPKVVVDQAKNYAIVEQLQELFGDKLEIL